MNKAASFLTSIRSTLFKNSRKLLLLFLVSFLHSAAIAENDIFRQLALSGKVFSTPFEVNSRIVAITDGGFISTFSTDGYRKYERPLKNRPSGDYTVTRCGIILSVSSNRRTVSFYNPDGFFVWSKTFDSEICNSPVEGYDGRIFVSTKDKLYCFGVTGGLRWERNIPAEISKPVRTLNDGTLLCISTPTGEDSLAYRFTPYGELLEEITFNGEAVLTSEHEDGVLMLFSDGTVGCCSVQQNKAISLWASLPIPNMRITKETAVAASILRLGQSYIAVLYPNGLIMTFNTTDGTEVYKTAVSSGFSRGSLFYGAGKIMAITQFAKETCFSVLDPLDGELVWSGLRQKKGDTLYFYTSDGFLLQFTENWVLSVSKPPLITIEILGKNQIKAPDSIPPIKRPRFYESYTNNAEENYIQELIQDFDDFIGPVIPVTNSFPYTGLDQSLFETDLISSVECIYKAANTGYDFSLQIGKIITNSNNELYIKSALEYTAVNGYDPDSYMLKAIYTFINTPHTYTISDSLYKKMCDAVSSICQFTGAEVFENYGSRILVKFMSSGYSTSIKEYAVNIMKILMDLQI